MLRITRRTALSLLTLPALARVAHAAGQPDPAPAPGAAAPAADATGTSRAYALTTLGAPKLPPDFPYFPYVNPDAPKGGEVTLAALGSFDSFNPFIVRGTPADGVNAVWDTLLRESADEASVGYGHLAQQMELPDNRMWVAFELRPQARFHDGTPVTAEDVAWTFDTLLKQGRPFYQLYYADVAQAVAESPTRVVFHFRSNENRELPLILGQMAVLPKHWWQGRDFSAPLNDPPLGSGPYRVDRFEAGRNVVFARAPDYWAANMPTGKGMDNFDTIRHEYFRDATVAMEAFKAGQIDLRQENISKNWATGYDFPAVTRGLVIKADIPQHLPTGMQGFAFNTRRQLFSDRRVREALAWAFDFEWENKNLFYGAYTRTLSYFSNSDLASSGIPQGDELALLNRFRDKLPPELFTTPFTLPVTDGSGNNREQLRRSLDLLQQAGWTVRNRQLLDPAGNTMSFTILLDDPTFERATLPYVQTLQKIGIDAHVRTVDPSQYQHQTDAFDFDMTLTTFPESDRPGNEQRDFWSSEAAKTQGSSNICGVDDPVVDTLVDLVINAPDLPHLLTATHALDRVLLWGWYVVPNWYLQSVRVAYWNRFGRPDKPVRSGFVFNTWWVDKKLAAQTDAARRA
jgi:microcin C transport system substrate-binding protein